MGNPSGNYNKISKETIESDDYVKNSSAGTITRKTKSTPSQTKFFDNIYGLPILYPEFKIDPKSLENKHPYADPILGPIAKDLYKLQDNPYYLSDEKLKSQYETNKAIQTFRAKRNLDPYDSDVWSGLNKNDKGELTKIIFKNTPLPTSNIMGGMYGGFGLTAKPLGWVWDELFDREDIGAYITKIGQHQLDHENIYKPIFDFNKKFLYQELLSKKNKAKSFGERSFWNKVLTPLEVLINIPTNAGAIQFMDLASSAGEENIRNFEKTRQELLTSGMSDYKATVEAYKETDFNPYYKGTLELIQPGDLALELTPFGLVGVPLIKAITRSSRLIRFNEIPATAFISWKNATFTKGSREGYEELLRKNTSLTDNAIEQKMKQFDDFGASQKDLDALEEVGVIKKNKKGEYIYKVKPSSGEGRHYTRGYNEKWNIVEEPSKGKFDTLTGESLGKISRTEKDIMQAMTTPDMAGATFNGTIYDIFPELLPEIQKLQKTARIKNLSEQPTLTRNPDLKDIPPQSMGKTFRDEGIGAVEAFDLPRMFGAIDPASVEDRSAIIGKLISEFRKTPVVSRIFSSEMIGKRQLLNNKEIEELSNFLNEFGIDLQSQSGDVLGGGALGKSFTNSDTGRNEYVIGIFDDPTKPSYAAGYNSAPYERFHILYSPSDNLFSVRRGLEPRVQALETSTGRNLTKEIENTSKRFDLEIEATRALRDLEPVMSPEYNRLSKIIYAREQAKEKRIRKLEELLSVDNFHKGDVTYVPDRSTAQRKKINDIDTVKYTEMLQIMYPYDYTLPRMKPSIRKDTVMQPDPDDIFSVKGAPKFKLSIERSIDPPDFGQKRLNDIYIDLLHNTRDYGNQYESMAATLELAAIERNLPKPSIPHGTAAMTGKWNDSVGALDSMLHGSPDQMGQDILASWWGHLNSEALDTQEWLNKSREIMKRMQLGSKATGNNWFVSREDGEELMRIIFADDDGLKKIEIPEKYKELYDHLMILRNKEQSDYLQFNPKLAAIFNEHVNYFPQMWRAADGFQMSKGSNSWIATKPGHLLPRADHTFEEKLEMGWDLISWNPFDLMALRRMRGIEHRHSVLMIDRFKHHGVAITEEAATKFNDSTPTLKQRLRRSDETIEYVKPNFGPAWTGHRMINPIDNSEILEEAIYIPKKVEQTIRGITQLSDDSLKIVTGMGSFDIGKAIGKFASVSKRSIIQFSLFQHHDMLTRGLSSGMSPTHLSSSGVKMWNPIFQNVSFVGRIAMAQLWGGNFKGFGRGATYARMMQDTPLYADFDITYKDLVKAGLQINGDTSVITRSHIENIKEIENALSKDELTKFPIIKDRIIGALKWWETGLFDGVYRETQLYIAEKQVIPQLRKRYPDASKEFIARKAADTVNILTSSLAPWQSVAKNPQQKALARALFFSTNELESWGQAAFRSMVGDQKGIYAQYWIGMYMYLASTANVINFMSTGSFLPMHAYNPITMKNKDGAWISFVDVTYNPRFLSPQIGNSGRNGAPIYLDLVGQADTIFHYALNGVKSLGDRTSPFISSFKPFVTGKTFYGEEIDSVIDKSKYAAMALLPMGAWQIVDKFREEIPFFEKHFPQGESGLGDKGRMIQGFTGVNVRKASYNDLLSEVANTAGFEKVPVTWNNLGMQLIDPKKFSAYASLKELGNKELQLALSLPQNKYIADELERRLQEGVTTNQPWALRGNQQQQYADQRMDELENLVVGIQTGKVAIRDWYDMMKDIDTRYYTQLSTLSDTYTKVKDEKERPDDASNPLEAARYDFFKAFEESKQYGSIDWQMLDYKITELELNSWTPMQTKHIEDYRLTKNYDLNYPSWFVDKLTARDKYKSYFQITENHMKNKGMLDTYRQWQISNNRITFQKEHPEFNNERLKVSAYKKEKRESPRNQELLLMLAQLGYIEVSTYLNIIKNNNR